MTFIDTIEHIRNKPDYTKRRIVFISSIIITIVIVTIWGIGSSFVTFPNQNENINDNQNVSQLKNVSNDIFETIGRGWVVIRGQFIDLKSNEQ